MDEWVALHGPQRGTIIVYEVPNERDLHLVWEHVEHDGVIFHEPDLGGEATAFATPRGPLDLPLLGSKLALAFREWPKKALKRARAMEAVMRRPEVDLPSPPMRE